MDRNELAKQLDDFSEDLDSGPITFTDAGVKRLLSLTRQAANALRESEEWRRDAERFRYLRDFPPRRRAKKDGNTQPSLNDMWVAAFLIDPAPGTIPTMDILEGDELDRRLDAAIDAARKEGV